MDGQKIGLYLRLSRDDERAGESMSIENQRSGLMQYVHRRGWQAAEIYSDDGYSGTNFDRPGFRRLLDDIAAGKIDTVITKDLSRLGRDQIGTAYYYQIYFPQHQVRYISVAEGFDTAEPGAAGALFPFLTAANDFYTADISRKVRAALTTRKREGKFIGASPPLGYRKDPEEKGHLIVEPEGAEVVRRIFRMYLAGGSVVGVAKALTEQGVPTPSQRKGGGITGSRFPGVWSDTMVRRILTNPTYAGHLTQNRREKVNYKLSRRITLPEEAWIIIPNTHEPLVSQDTFDRVREMLAVRSYTHSGRGGHLLTGLAFCADCGAPMTYVRESEKRTCMVCQGYRKGGRLHLCTAHRIREDAVIGAIQRELRALAGQLDEREIQKALQNEDAADGAQRRQRAARQKLERLNAVLEQLYQDREAGVLLEGEFRTLLARNREERAGWEGVLEEARQHMEQESTHRDFAEQIHQFLTFDTLDRAAVTSLLARVLIHADQTVELEFRFRRPDGQETV
ncbi:MAG: recombinase family protein [Clostridiales bacterium]|nr:recombinase family protein [Clostridiales bacterium]